MSNIHLTKFIEAPVERVFDLTRNLTVLRALFNERKETLHSGAGGNLLEHGETVSIHARHLGKTRMVTLRVTTMQSPLEFTEEQVKGDLENFRHQHHFKAVENGTILIDLIDFGEARGFMGGLLSKLYLKSYLVALTERRNELIRQYAESEKWRVVM